MLGKRLSRQRVSRVVGGVAVFLALSSVFAPVMAEALLTPTVSISPSSGTAYPATKFYISISGLTPSRQYRLQVWDGGGTQRWSQYYTSTSSGTGSTTHQWWWTAPEVPGQYRVRVTDYSGGYKDGYFTVNVNPTISVSPTSGTTSPATKFYITVGGLTPSSQYRLQVWDGGGTQRWSQLYTATSTGAGASSHQWWWTSGETPGTYRARVTDVSGKYKETTFTITQPVTVNPSISISPTSGTAYPATKFYITVGGLTPSSQFRFQVWDGGGTQRWSQYYTSTSNGVGSSTYQWWWTSPEVPGQYRVRVTDVSGKYKDAYFTINVNPTITVSPSTGTTSPATKFNLTVGGLTPMAQYRLQVWDGGGTQRWSQYYNAAYDGGGASVHQWWWTTGETPGTYRARVTDITGKYKETTFTITQPVGNLSVSFTENPFTCDGGLRTFGTISGATPGETITFTSSPPLTLASGAANSSGQLAIKWQCTPAEVQTWSVTARGASSGRTVTFSVVGKAPVATVNPTVSVSPSSGTTAPATVFTITIGGLTPSGTYRLQIWDGGNVRRWDKNYVATSTGAGSRNHQWYWESPETPGTYRVRVTDLASTKYKETTFVITKTTVNTKPLVIFVQGMNTSADGSSASPGEWQGLRALLGTGYDYAMFSYADDYADSARTLPRYDTDDTCGSIDTESSPGLSQRFLTWYDQVSTGRIAVHVVTHSMGGVVVVYALTIRTPTNLRSVTTLDSPLAGSLPAAIADLFPAVGCGWWADRYDDLVSDSVVIRTIQTLRVSSTIARLLTTVGNKLDLVVRNGISHTGSEWLSTAISTACDGDAWNHACVFDSAIARQALINNVRKGAGLPSVFSCDGLTATLAGTSGWDRIRGTRGADIIYGGARGDVLYGYNGDDRLCGGTGNDSFYGGEGTDRCDIVALEANTSCEVKSS